jgi:hypothetical protein
VYTRKNSTPLSRTLSQGKRNCRDIFGITARRANWSPPGPRNARPDGRNPPFAVDEEAGYAFGSNPPWLQATLLGVSRCVTQESSSSTPLVR